MPQATNTDVQAWVKYGQVSFAWRHHNMETLSALLDLFQGNPPVTSVLPSHRARNAELRCFQYSWIAVRGAVELPVISVDMSLMRPHCDEAAVKFLQHTYNTHTMRRLYGRQYAVFWQLNMLPVSYLTPSTSSAARNIVFLFRHIVIL